jgi:hypothetical protein
MLTSITPGSGVTCEHLQARVARRRVAFNARSSCLQRLPPWLRPPRAGQGSPPDAPCGGMKTYSTPLLPPCSASAFGPLARIGSRTSTHNAVRVIQWADSWRCGARVAIGAELGVRGLDLAAPVGLLGAGPARAAVVALPCTAHHAALGKAAAGGVGRIATGALRAGLHGVVLGAQRCGLGQGVAAGVGVLLDHVGVVGLADTQGTESSGKR